uniref:NAD dependent epimerase/dehydratase family protein n=1 Tax=Neospora caninum (strain Liverpool) TaxID=572307 RepID=A0A0F7UI36_NEOCL|nr:TPA: NAD dependent epimerase/dehydratase family protein [Neospora caninum Liverpool]
MAQGGEERRSRVTSGSLPPQRVLVLGGTAFIGRVVTRRLHDEDYPLVFVNRGRSYWEGNGIDQAEYHRADRRDPKAFADCVADLTEREEATRGRSWLAVVDFSAYKPRDIQASLAGLGGRYGLYIYISTDSVYEVSDSSLWKARSSVTEDLAVRPKEKDRVAILKKKDAYGHNKLAVEEVLREQVQRDRRPVVCLRLADVVGPFDDTDRFWTYFWWTQVGHPILVEPSAVTQRMNLTFVEDVAAAVSCLLRLPLPAAPCRTSDSESDAHASGSSSSSSSPEERNEGMATDRARTEHETLFRAYNLACEETLTLVEMLKLLHKRCALYRRQGLLPPSRPASSASVFSGETDLCENETASGEREEELNWTVEEDCLKCPSFLPSVCRETPLSMAKIRSELRLSLTPLEEAIHATCDWLVPASRRFPKEAAEAVKRLPAEARQAVRALHQDLHPFLPSSSSSSSSLSGSEDSSDEEEDTV